MQTYDALPVPLRQWLAYAALSWSLKSAERIWQRVQQRGLDVEDALRTLDKAESKTLARDEHPFNNLAQLHSV